MFPLRLHAEYFLFTINKRQWQLKHVRLSSHLQAVHNRVKMFSIILIAARGSHGSTVFSIVETLLA